MAGLPHMRGSKAIPRILSQVRSEAVPDRVTPEYLRKHQYADPAAVVSILRALGFTSKADKPTQLWIDSRDPADAAVVLASAVRDSYAVLFDAYPDAQDQPDAALGKVLRIHTKYSNTDIQRTVATFRQLCAAADFTQPPPRPTVVSPAPEPVDVAELDSWPGRRANRRSLSELAELAGDVGIPDTSTILQAVTCIEQHLYPQAHVTAWNAYMECALELLPGDAGDVASRPDRQVIDALLGAGLCSDSEHGWLVPLLQRRHQCAHVTGFVPTEAQALWYVDAVLEQIAALTSRTAG